MQELPKTITRRYWYSTVVYHKLSEEKSNQFFTAVAGDYYKRPVPLYFGEDKKYYFCFQLNKIDERTGNSFLLCPTGISRNDIFDIKTKTYHIFNEQMLRNALYNMCCVYYDNEVLKDENLLSKYKKIFPLHRVKRSTQINEGPVPKKPEERLRKPDTVAYAQSNYDSPKLLNDILSEDETKSIMNAIYGKTDDYVFFTRDVKTGELFIWQEVLSKNYYDKLQLKYDFDYDFIEKNYHVCEKFDRPEKEDDWWMISSYFNHAEKNMLKAMRSLIVKTGVRTNMLKKSNDSDLAHQYIPLSFDELQKVYMNVIYSHWELW